MFICPHQKSQPSTKTPSTSKVDSSQDKDNGEQADPSNMEDENTNDAEETEISCISGENSNQSPTKSKQAIAETIVDEMADSHEEE